MISNVVDLVAAQGDRLGEEVTLRATIRVSPVAENGDNAALASRCLRITLCYEDPVGMQSVCQDAYIC